MSKIEKPAKAKRGRPSSYSEEVADVILQRIMGGEGLVTICMDDDMPGTSTVYRWLAAPENELFRDRYARAREVQADVLADEILRIADTPQVGRKVKIDADGEEEITEGDMIEHRRLQVDARKWYASKLAPKKYGDKQQVEHSGSLSIADALREAKAKRRQGAGDAG